MSLIRYLTPFIFAPGIAFAQPTVNQTVFHTDTIERVTSVTQVFGRSQNVTHAIVQFAEPVAAQSIDAASFRVDGRTVLGALVVSRPEVGAEGQDGRFVILSLDPADAASTVFAPGIDEAPETVVRLVAPVALAGGGTAQPTEDGVINTAVSNLIVDDFRQFRFTDPETGLSLDYNLFIPADHDGDKAFPMVMFLHDAGVTGMNPLRTLRQGRGAVSFASAEAQADHPSFVLAPQFPVPLANDASQTSVYVEMLPRLIADLVQTYGLDRDRLYTTGQSGGCMTSIALDIAQPDLFAGTFCVAGQWDAAQVAPAARASFWALVSEDDAKAFPGMTAIMAEWEANGASVTRGKLDARAPAPATAAKVAELRARAQGNVFFTTFKAGSVLPDGEADNPGAGHVNTWVYAYDIPAIRDWLFAQER